VRSPGFCVRGLVLGQNPYLHFKFYIEIDVMDDTEVTHQFRFHFQDGSTEGWVGVRHIVSEDILNSFFTRLEYKRSDYGAGVDALTIAMGIPTFMVEAPKIMPGTMSVFESEMKNGDRYVLVSFMGRPSTSPYAMTGRPICIAIRYPAAGGVEVAESLWLSSKLDFPLEAERAFVSKLALQTKETAKLLLEISR
jgi:hypothetical protein